MRALFLMSVAAVAIVACATLGSGSSSYPTAEQCPVFAEYDPAALAAAGDPLQNPQVAAYDTWARARVDEVPVPAEAASAATRIRVRVPATGMWRLDDYVTAWKDNDGRWRIARRRVDYSQPPPPPPPPPYPTPPDWQPPPQPSMEERFPLFVGPADAATAARLDAYLADPCMNAEPTRFGHTLPRRSGPPWVCVPDSSAMAGEIVEPDRTRLITVRCENDMVTSDFLRFVYGAAGIEEGHVERRTSW
ncbi:MAG: hypothetical protein R3C30_14815 [Hyphomonadaceae bacterium]